MPRVRAWRKEWMLPNFQLHLEGVSFGDSARVSALERAGEPGRPDVRVQIFFPRSRGTSFYFFCLVGVPLFSTSHAKSSFFFAGVLIPAKLSNVDPG